MKKLIQYFKIIIITFSLFLLFDAFIGKYLYKKFIQSNLQDVDNSLLGIKNNVYDHELNRSINRLAGWGDLRYKICTDTNGFRISCDEINKKDTSFDIGFIGDSFTEGVGVNYEDSFVGIINKNLKNLKVANLAVTSYGTTIYYAKINHLISKGYNFKEIVVFIDLSDLKDDTSCYSLKNEKVVRKKTFSNCYENINKVNNKLYIFLKKNFKFSSLIFKSVNKILNDLGVIQDHVSEEIVNHSRSEWTYDYKPQNFDNLTFDKSIVSLLKNMALLSALLKKNSIELSVAVYPWPGTIYNDKADNQQFQIWKKFCSSKCKNFYNFMPVFFFFFANVPFSKNYKRYFINEDIHFNEKGHELIANTFLEKYLETK